MTPDRIALMKLKIAYFIDAYAPGAGTEDQLRGILQHLDPDRVEATLFTLREEVAPEHQKELPWPVECLHVQKLRSFDSLKKFVRLVFRLRREKYDIVMIYFNDTNLFVTPACYLAGIKNCVVNRRNIGYSFSPRLLKWLNRVNGMTDYFLTNSRLVKEQTVRTEGFPAERICVIYNGLWKAEAPPATPLSRREMNLPEDAPVVGIVANLRPVKRIDRFIDMAAIVARELPAAHFLILGQGELESDLRAQATRLNLSNQVHFLGRVEDIFAHLPVFDVAVLTSESEGLSNSLIEYAFAGVPAVAFDVGGNREVIDNGNTGIIVEEGNTEGLGQAVLSILKDTALRERFSSAARARAAELFDAASAMRQTMRFYDSIVGSDRRSCRFD